MLSPLKNSSGLAAEKLVKYSPAFDDLGFPVAARRLHRRPVLVEHPAWPVQS